MTFRTQEEYQEIMGGFDGGDQVTERLVTMNGGGGDWGGLPFSSRVDPDSVDSERGEPGEATSITSTTSGSGGFSIMELSAPLALAIGIGLALLTDS